MNRAQALDRLAQNRQALDQTYRAMLPDTTWSGDHAGIELEAITCVLAALDLIASAITIIDTPTITPESPHITHLADYEEAQP